MTKVHLIRQFQGGGHKLTHRARVYPYTVNELRLAYAVAMDLPFDLARQMCSSLRKVVLNPIAGRGRVYYSCKGGVKKEPVM